MTVACGTSEEFHRNTAWGLRLGRFSFCLTLLLSVFFANVEGNSTAGDNTSSAENDTKLSNITNAIEDLVTAINDTTANSSNVTESANASVVNETNSSNVSEETPAPTPALEATTTLEEGAAAGSTVLKVADVIGFVVGDAILIESAAGAEYNTIKGFSSIILQSPLKYTHPAGTTIKQLKHDDPRLQDHTHIEMTMADVQAAIAELRAELAAEKAKTADNSARLDENDGVIAAIYESFDTGWLLYNTSLVFLMQMGFALVEAGSVRKKSYRHVFLKNLMDISVGMALWLIIGYWIAFPGKWEGVFTEFEKFDMFFIAAEGRFYAFQSVFASTAITIVSGAMAERTRMEAYLAFCAICGAMVYAVVVRWTWGGGWLSEFDIPYHDFAGSGVVHATGGAAAFVGAALVGPRAGRWEPEASLHDDDQYKPHSVDNIVMGTFILWFGWYGFNPGSTCGLVEDSADTAAIAYVNTMICPVFAAITVMIIGVVRNTRYKGPDDGKPPLFDLGGICNGVLGGLVGITAGCDAIPPEWTMILGIMSGFGVHGWSTLMKRCKIDDPVDASAVHGCCGAIGVLGVGLFHKDTGLCTSGNGDLFVTQLKGISAIIGYVCGTAFVYFYVVHAFGFLRLDMLVEVLGIDRVDFAHIEHVDVTQLEIMAVNRYRARLLDRFEGHLWGISDQLAIKYAKMHRTLCGFLLILAMVYNYFYYTYFEWRGWDFFSVMNLAVGCQCAAASHAEYMCKAGDPRIQQSCVVVIIIGLGLAVCNFLLAPHGNLLLAWLRTMTLSFSWSLWMHLRVHPVDWDQVCKAKTKAELTTGDSASLKLAKTDSSVMIKALFEMGATQGCFQYIKKLFLVGRFQHIGESTLSYASVTSDLWVGLDEWRNYFDDDSEESGSLPLGLALVIFSLLQSLGTMSRLVVATRRRSIRFFQCVLALTTFSEAPILILVFTNSDSSLKWVSVFFSSASIFFQCFNLMVAVVTKRSADSASKFRPQLMDIPLPSLEPPSPPAPKPKLEEAPAQASKIEEAADREPSEHSVEIIAPPKSVGSQNKGTPPHLEQVSLIQSPPDTNRSPTSGTPMMTSRTPRMTTPRSLLEASQILLSVPPKKRHSPMHTPRGYTPRNP